MVYVVMGVAGCGKTTVGAALAWRLNARFVDADDYHSESNKAKMGRGEPLSDEERREWLDVLLDAVGRGVMREKHLVLACSALKRKHRDRLTAGIAAVTDGAPAAAPGKREGIVRFIYLKCGINTVKHRLALRQDHFMPPSLADSQFDDLEEPVGEPCVTTADGELPVDKIVDGIVCGWRGDDNKCDIGVAGLAVMGQNLILNMNDRGYSAAVYNRTISTVDDFLMTSAAGRTGIVGAYSAEQLCEKLKRPRKLLLLIKAGESVDEFIEQLLPFLEPGDCVIDGGNSNYKDTERRARYLKEKGLVFCGVGISGGEEGARNGPSIMPGGDVDSWRLVKYVFQAVCAKTPEGDPCCEWVGPGGAGHFVKMVHNGIEYGDMQLISEAYSLLKETLGMDHNAMAEVFAAWNKTELDSYLIEITSNILRYKDYDGSPLVEKILDCAGQKGTGKWMTQSALELDAPITLISEAVSARMVSARIDERSIAAFVYPAGGDPKSNKETAGAKKGIDITVDDIRKALLASKIVSYAQGFMLVSSASSAYQWGLDLGKIALLWRGGCIIRSVFLKNIQEAYSKKPDLRNLLFDGYFSGVICECLASWRKVVAAATLSGIPVPALSSGLAFFDAYRREHSSANLLQAQRDYFGAHMYERTDRPRGEFFHTDWAGTGGNAVSGAYLV